MFKESLFSLIKLKSFITWLHITQRAEFYFEASHIACPWGHYMLCENFFSKNAKELLIPQLIVKSTLTFALLFPIINNYLMEDSFCEIPKIC